MATLNLTLFGNSTYSYYSFTKTCFTTIQGSKSFLFVAGISAKTGCQDSGLYLLNKRGRLLYREPLFGGQDAGMMPDKSVHKMAYFKMQAVGCLLVQHMHGHVSLFAVLPRPSPRLVWLTSHALVTKGLNWALVPVPLKKGEFYSGSVGFKARLVKISFKLN